MSTITRPVAAALLRIERARQAWLRVTIESITEPCEWPMKPEGFWRDAGHGVEQWVTPR